MEGSGEAVKGGDRLVFFYPLLSFILFFMLPQLSPRWLKKLLLYSRMALSLSCSKNKT